MNRDEVPNRTPGPDEETATPYGPQPKGTDEAAGGADSSPYENEPTGERMDVAEAERRTGRGSDTDAAANQSP